MTNISKHYLIAFIAALFLGGYFFFYPNRISYFDRTNQLATSTEHEVEIETTTEKMGDVVAPVSSSDMAKQQGTKSTTAAHAPQPSAPKGGLPSSVYKEFVRPTGFLNTYTLNLPDRNTFELKDFVGKQVILLNFWTSSSPNALRMFPYLASWYNTYKEKGLLVVSVHVPRFSYERTQDIVSKTAFAWNVVFPIVLDNNYETWNAYKNTTWPTTYLIDINGRIAATYIGEGSYAPIEAKIQQLLLARSEKLGLSKDVYAAFATPKDAIPVELERTKSPEVYFGAARNTALANGSALKEGIQDFEIPSGDLLPHKFYLSGSWNITKESGRNLIVGAKVRERYEGKYVHAVMGGSGSLKIRILRDGAPLPQHAAGKDIRYEKGESVLYVSGSTRIYEIVADENGYDTHTIELIFENSGIEVYTLAFS